MDRVMLMSRDWNSGPISYARTFWERWRGTRGRPAGTALLLETSSVHGFGVSEPFWAVALDARLEVMGTKLVRPRRIVGFPGSQFVLELPVDAEAPTPGTRIEMRHV